MFNRSEVLEVIGDFRAGRADDRVIDILLEYIELTNVKQEKLWKLTNVKQKETGDGYGVDIINLYKVENTISKKSKWVNESELNLMNKTGLL